MATQKILIVDDDPDIRQALRLRLRANHYETVNACDGYSAIAQAYRSIPTLLFWTWACPPGTALWCSTGCGKTIDSPPFRWSS
jgi:DNA-binding response OmpR family regulator